MLFGRTVDGGKELVQQRAIAGRRAAQEERRMRESKRSKRGELRHQTLRKIDAIRPTDPPAELARAGERPCEFMCWSRFHVFPSYVKVTAT